MIKASLREHYTNCAVVYTKCMSNIYKDLNLAPVINQSINQPIQFPDCYNKQCSRNMMQLTYLHKHGRPNQLRCQIYTRCDRQLITLKTKKKKKRTKADWQTETRRECSRAGRCWGWGGAKIRWCGWNREYRNEKESVSYTHKTYRENERERETLWHKNKDSQDSRATQ